MKKSLFLILIFPLFLFSQEKYHVDLTEWNSDSTLSFLISTNEPISGIVFGSHLDKRLKNHEVTFLNGKRISCIGYFKNNKIHHQAIPNGLSKWYYKNGNTFVEIISRNGKFEGLSKSYYKTGELQEEGNYVNDAGEGLWKTYYKTGVLESEINYVGGKTEGLMKFYFSDGTLQRKGNYKDGLMHGKWTLYKRNGEFKKEIRYKNGNIIK